MCERPITRMYLETLTNSALTELAEELDLDLPPKLNRIFIIEEILEAGLEEEDPVDDDEELLIDDNREPVAVIPETYFATYLHVLLRDPYWAYAFWEVRATERAEMEKAEGFGGFCLRVWSLKDRSNNMTETSFSVSLVPEDCAWYLCLPGTSSWYRVDLCLIQDGKEKVLASSGAFRVPPSPDTVKKSLANTKALAVAELCGLDSLPILRARDRDSRMPGACE